MKTKLVFGMLLVAINYLVSAQVPLNVSRNNTNSPDKYCFQKPLESEKADLFADEKAMEYVHFFSNAIDNPNTLVEVDKDNKLLKGLSFTKKLVKINKKEIIYDDSKKTISLIETKHTEEKNSFIWISAILLITLVVISNILFSFNHKKIAQMINLFVSLATLASTLNVTTKHLTFLIALVLVLVACVIVICADKSGGVAAGVVIASLAIPGLIICITIVVEIFKSGFTFFILIPASAMTFLSAIDSDYDNKEEVLMHYALYSFIYYIIIAVHVILLFVVY